MIRVIFFCLTFLLITLHTNVQAMFGYSSMPCIELINKHEQDGYVDTISHWLDGYFSGRQKETGHNLSIVQELNIPIYDLLLKVCNQNPMLSLQQSADMVFEKIPKIIN